MKIRLSSIHRGVRIEIEADSDQGYARNLFFKDYKTWFIFDRQKFEIAVKNAIEEMTFKVGLLTKYSTPEKKNAKSRRK